MQEFSITDTMRKNHLFLMAALSNFKQKLDLGHDNAKSALDDFKDKLEKHFNIEERVIFKFIDKTDSELAEIEMVLLDEHKKMLNMVETIMRDLKDKDPKDLVEDLESFDKVHIKHMAMEEISLYPKLDQNLSKEEKDGIYRKIEQSF